MMRIARVIILGYLVVLTHEIAIGCRSTPPVTVPTDGPTDASPSVLPPVPPPPDGSTGSDADIAIETTDPCTLITAQTADETSTTCATHDEADVMTRFILQQRLGSDPEPKPCAKFPPTQSPAITICASDAEVIHAIDFLSDQRRTEMQRHQRGQGRAGESRKR